MKPLTPPDSIHLLAAEGWLELGSHLEADRELDDISPAMRVHPDVLDIRWEIHAKEKKWSACVDIGHAIIDGDADRSSGWIKHSFALHELQRTDEAFMHLATVAEDFPGDWHVPYNPACYCAQLGQIEESKQWFKRAVTIDDKAVPKAGIDDPDLKPLWDSLQGSEN